MWTQRRRNPSFGTQKSLFLGPPLISNQLRMSVALPVECDRLASYVLPPFLARSSFGAGGLASCGVRLCRRRVAFARTHRVVCALLVHAAVHDSENPNQEPHQDELIGLRMSPTAYTVWPAVPSKRGEPSSRRRIVLAASLGPVVAAAIHASWFSCTE